MTLYKPTTPAALDKLVKIVLSSEEAYFGNLDWVDKHLYLKGNKAYPGPGELQVSLPITGVVGTPAYLLEPNLTTDGRKAYSSALEGCLKISAASATSSRPRIRGNGCRGPCSTP